jgi:hypothetical protein
MERASQLPLFDSDRESLGGQERGVTPRVRDGADLQNHYPLMRLAFSVWKFED